MIAPDNLYIMDVTEFTAHLFRMGNATWPSFNEERARSDVRIELQNGIEAVIANGNGFSAFDHITPAMKKPGKFIWRIRKGARIPDGLRLVQDRSPGKAPGHYMIAPAKDMPLKKYLGLLEELGMDRSRCEQLSAQEVQRG